jgi:4'-phosphopantetheinyl transferase
MLRAVRVMDSERSPGIGFAALPAAPLKLQPVLMELWVIHVAEVDATQLDQTLLDREERLRAARLARPDDRRSYLAAHTLLRLLLGARLELPPQDVAYLREPCPSCGAPHGRPALDSADRPLHFSLSRSAGLMLIAIAPAPVGVDVEILPPPETIAEVSALLHPGERAEVLSAAPTSRARVFATIWTRKEAYLKGIGVGIAADLATEYLGIERWTALGSAETGFSG